MSNNVDSFIKYGGWVAAIVATTIAVNNYVQNPQRMSEARIADLQAQITSNRDLNTALTKTNQNDVQEVKSRLTDIERNQKDIREQIVRLQTVIEERIPPKKL